MKNMIDYRYVAKVNKGKAFIVVHSTMGVTTLQQHPCGTILSVTNQYSLCRYFCFIKPNNILSNKNFLIVVVPVTIILVVLQPQNINSPTQLANKNSFNSVFVRAAGAYNSAKNK